MSVKLQLQNKIMNGAFDFWQRGTSFAAIANNVYHTDRFHYIKTGAMVHTISRSTDVPSTSSSLYSLLATPTTIDASIAAGEYTGILQHIEGNVLRSFEGKKMVLTFWVKAFKTGTYCISLRNGTATRSLVLEYTVGASNTWEKKTVRFTHDMSGSWTYDTGIGLTAVFVIASGSTFNTTAGTWQNGQFFATANQVNGVDSLSNSFQLADICMVEDNEGQTRVPDFVYAGRDYFEELQLCQRYYEKGGDSFPGQQMTHNFVFTNTATYTTGCVYPEIFFKIPKRIIPPIAFYDVAVTPSISNITRYSAGGGAATHSTSATATATKDKFYINLVTAAGIHAGCAFSWYADAEL